MSGKIPKTHLIPQGKPIKVTSDNKVRRFKNQEAKPDNNDEAYLELTELLVNSRIVYKAKTVFPFNFFPDELIIDKDKVSIISQAFFNSDRHQSVLIKNIADCYVDTSLFFGTLNIRDKYFEDKVISIDHLKKNDAIFARNIIQGLALCQEKQVDISTIKPEDLLPYLEEIGKATEY